MATIVVWFSCGAASAVAAKKTIELYGDTHTVRVVNNPVIEEDEDNTRFLLDVEKWLGITIERCTNAHYPEASAVVVWNKRNYMVGVKGAPCTVQLKKEARYQWESINNPDYHVLGFTSEELGRHKRFKLMERDSILPVLIEHNITKQQCIDILLEAGINPPRVYEMGYPNANCIGCVKATSATYWNHVRNMHPYVFESRALQSRRIGARLVRHKGKRIYLDELPPDATGRKMKQMNVECGIFCDITKSF
jgi:hypothetical protein